MRIIYYWLSPKDQIFMLLAYRKNQQDDLTAEQKRMLIRLVIKEPRMDKKLFDELVSSVKEAGKIKRGQKKPSRITEMKPPDVQKIRKKAGLSQSQFARMLHVSPKTLQNWEQKRRQPNGPAIALLKVVDREPEMVLRTLHQRRAA